MHKIINGILNILYPRHCPVCHKILKNQQRLVCTKCETAFVPISGNRCFRCSKPVEAEQEYCKECTLAKREFDEGLGLFFYDEKIKGSLLQYKYSGRREYGDFYAVLMSCYAREKIRKWKPHVIVPIPMHKRKQRMRGFNQAAYLAERIGDYYEIPVAKEILCKVQSTKSQKKLDAASRRKNLQKAFSVTE